MSFRGGGWGVQQFSTLSPQKLLEVPQLVSQTRQLEGKCNIPNSQRVCGDKQVLVLSVLIRTEWENHQSMQMRLRYNPVASSSVFFLPVSNQPHLHSPRPQLPPDCEQGAWNLFCSMNQGLHWSWQCPPPAADVLLESSLAMP